MSGIAKKTGDTLIKSAFLLKSSATEGYDEGWTVIAYTEAYTDDGSSFSVSWETAETTGQQPY